MSLQVWLPLNGDLKNKGVYDIVIPSSNFSNNSDGKIGLCVKCSTSSLIDTGIPSSVWDFTTKSISFGGWVKINQAELAEKTSTYTYSGKYITCGGTLFGRHSYGGFGLRWETNDLTSNTTPTNVYLSVHIRSTNGSWSTNKINLPFDTWTHIFVVFDRNNETLQFYRNGELFYSNSINVTTYTTSGNINQGTFLINQNSWHADNGNATCAPWYINDFRLYDHALSVSEVKEISRGLILHYPLTLNKPVIYNGDNLLLGTELSGKYITNFQSNDTTDWNSYLRFYNGSASLHTFSNGTDTVRLNGSGNLGISFIRKATDIDLDPNSYYTISCKAKCTKITNLCIGLSYYTTSNTWVWRGGSNPVAFNAVNTWQTFTLTFKPDANTQYINYCFTVVGTSGSTDSFTIKECKLEKGSTATEWRIGHRVFSIDNTICDVSGYGNNGTFVGTLQSNSSTPRYDSSIVFSGSNYICAGQGAKVKDTISICCWAYMDDWASINSNKVIFSCTQYGGWGIVLQKTEQYLRVYMGTGTTTNTYKLVNSQKTLSELNGTWRYIVVTYDGLSVKLYIDGELDNSLNAYSTKTPIYYNATNGIFVGAEAASDTTNIESGIQFIGKISDVRIYATALSADDVKQLYEVSGKIDNKGNMHCYKLCETSDGRELMVLPLTTPYTSKTNPYKFNSTDGIPFSGAGSSCGTDYIEINPSGKKYIYDFTISVAAGNQFYIGFERYDADKTARTNNACVYPISIKPTADIVKQRYTGTVNLSTDGVNPCKYIRLRVLNAWTGTDESSTKLATIHHLSLREMPTNSTAKTKLYKNGLFETDLLIEGNSQTEIEKNFDIYTNQLIEI